MVLVKGWRVALAKMSPFPDSPDFVLPATGRKEASRFAVRLFAVLRPFLSSDFLFAPRGVCAMCRHLFGLPRLDGSLCALLLGLQLAEDD